MADLKKESEFLEINKDFKIAFKHNKVFLFFTDEKKNPKPVSIPFMYLMKGFHSQLLKLIPSKEGES